MPIKSNEQLLHEDVTYKIRGACFKIWKEFGGAFKESIIDRALTEELRKQKLEIENQKRIDIFYENKKVGTYVPDKIINNSVLVELKCKPFLTKEDKRQFWLYLKATDYKIGLLINFGSHELDIKRFIYDKARKFPHKSA
ncbi:MAG: GxxExxY protein [Candidatus Sungbacteria bacterium]|nr:GxxExxY protein [Candidatus Sungbacteria bacterium]